MMEVRTVNTGVITDASEVTAAWLEAVLRAFGALRAGRVTSIEVQGDEATWSHNARIVPCYSHDATGEHPAALFLKMVQNAAFGPSEVQYAARDYAGLADAPVPRCYDARYDAERRAYHLLLEDLGATHTNTWELPVTPAFVAALGDALAALHAHRWTPAQLAPIGADLPGTAEIERYMAHISQGLAPLLDIGGEDVRPEWRALLPRIFAQHPGLMRERARDPHGLCLVHGDVNPGNILAPRVAGGRVYIVDRQPFDWSLTVWLGVSDLAYLMCSFWSEATRRAHETPLLRAYHDGLLRRGVTGYPWDRLWRDYRLTAVQSVYVAVEWCVLPEDRERMRWLWSAELRRAMAAFEDLGCAELLEETEHEDTKAG
jgi:hypothetical protein